MKRAGFDELVGRYLELWSVMTAAWYSNNVYTIAPGSARKVGEHGPQLPWMRLELFYNII
jgi:hypothetical protein